VEVLLDDRVVQQLLKSHYAQLRRSIVLKLRMAGGRYLLGPSVS